MKELSPKFSLKQGAEYYGKNPASVKRALVRGALVGYKDINGWWWFYKKNGDEYFHGPAFPEWGRFICLFTCCGISRYLATNARDEGLFESKRHHYEWYIKLYEWSQYLISTGMINVNIDHSSFVEFNTKISIGTAEATDVCRIVNENPRTLIYLWVEGGVWIYWCNRPMIHLINLEIFKGEKVRAQVYGNSADEVSRLIYEKLAA